MPRGTETWTDYYRPEGARDTGDAARAFRRGGAGDRGGALREDAATDSPHEPAAGGPFPSDPAHQPFVVAPTGSYAPVGPDMLRRVLVGLRESLLASEGQNAHEAEYELLDSLDDALGEAEIRRRAEELGTRLIGLVRELAEDGTPATSLAAVLELATEPLPAPPRPLARTRRARSARALLTRRALALEDLLRQVHR
ncbi:hypothetical protein ACIQUL_29570 [Streptomyces sp. NPDC090303]|uniref:hypothetical protein n=1 Tax=Streptomyces sp. NPDC090303 TaxID=3365960 RepID=UPI0038273108